MANRRKFPLFNSFRQFVLDELVHRKEMYPQPTSAPFVRMTAATSDPILRYKYFSIGLHGYEPDATSLFDPIYGQRNDVVGYAYSTDMQDNNGHYKKRLIASDELTINLPDVVPEGVDAERLQRMGEKTLKSQIDGVAHGAHPIPGITSVRIDTNNPNMPLIAQVEWKCYNKQQLEFLRHHFMIVGNHIILEWGNMYSNRVPSKILDFGAPGIDEVLADIVIRGRNITYRDWIEPNNGNYDFIVGFVGNFQTDIDAKRNIYTCTTTIYTTGEQLRGLSIHQTHVTTANVDPKDSGKIANIADFFKVGGPFDALLNKTESRKDIAILKSDFKTLLINSSTDLSQGHSNPNDLVYITWKFFTHDVIKTMFSMLDNPDIRGDLFDIVQYYNDPENQNRLPDRVGDNQWLRSTDASTMVLVRRLNMEHVPSELSKAGYFDEGGGGEWGDLNQGIWLNISAIRECFLQSYSFDDAMQSLLMRMNRAVVNYWQLGIYYDDEEAIYKIVDYKYGELSEFPTTYKFNVGGVGETLDIKMESSFPPEMVGMLAMTAKFKSESPERQKELLSRMPLLGTTSHYAYALNWTNLQDVVQQAIAKRRSEKRNPMDILGFAQGTSINQTDKLRDTQRITGAGLPDFLNPMKTVTSPEPGKKLGDILPSFMSDKEDAKPVIRNSVSPISNARAQSAIKKSKPFDAEIERAAAKHGVDANLIRAIIATESDFNTSKKDTLSVSGAHGLGQFLIDTARGLGYKGDVAGLYDPATNIDLVGAYIKNLYSVVHDKTLDTVISAYNGGPNRPGDGLGARANFSGYVCLARDISKPIMDEATGKQKTNSRGRLLYECARDKKGNEMKVWVNVGEYANQDYIDKVKGFYNAFQEDQQKQPIPNTPVVQQNPRLEYVPGNIQGLGIGESKSDTKTKEGTEEKFGSDMLLVIEQNPSRMLSMIVKSGLDSTPPHNNFVAPFPTSAKVTLTLLGLSGFSLTDIFVVDKLPFIYDNYGAFQVTRISEQITPAGWMTILQGTFKFLWFDGSGPKNVVW